MRIKGERRIGKTTLAKLTLAKKFQLITIDFLGVCDMAEANQRIQVGLIRAAEQQPTIRRLFDRLSQVNEVKLGPLALKV